MRIEKVIGHKSGLSCKKYAEYMRELCSDPERIFEINGELWLEIADMLEKQDTHDEVVALKQEFDAVLHRAEGLERKVLMLGNECEEGRTIVEFQKGKIEAYEFAFRCIGGKDGN